MAQRRDAAGAECRTAGISGRRPAIGGSGEQLPYQSAHLARLDQEAVVSVGDSMILSRSAPDSSAANSACCASG